MEAKDLLPQQRFVSMQVDEMGIRPALEYNRTHQKNTGQVDIGGLTGKEDESEGGTLANSMCNVLIKGMTDSLSVLLASYPVKALDAITLKLIILNSIEEAEKAGFFVIRVVGDNAKINEKLFELLRQPGDNPETPWVVTHPLDPRRKLFLAYDATHIIKNVRNQFLDRTLTINGNLIRPDLIHRLFDRQKAYNLRLVRKLCWKHIKPTNMERMKVLLALLLFSPEMTAALETCQAYDVYGFQNIQPTIDFLKRFWRWWEMHDVSNSTQFVQQRKEDKMPFYSEDDPRLTWLQEDFVKWLDEWKAESDAILKQEEATQKLKQAQEKQVAKNKNTATVTGEEAGPKKITAKSKIFLTNETYKALRLTTNSTVDCIKYLLKECDFLYVLTAKMTTDEIERVHGSLRHFCGHNDHPTAAAALAAADKMARTALARSSMNCNVPLQTPKGAAKTGAVQALTRQRPKERPRAQIVLANLPPELSKILEELTSDPGI